MIKLDLKTVLGVLLAAAVFFSIAAMSEAQESPYTGIIEAAGTSGDYDGADIVTVFDSAIVDVEEVKGDFDFACEGSNRRLSSAAGSD